jgi:hypothetical protein
LNKNSWNKFKKARECFRQAVDELAASLPELKKIQQKLVDSRSEVSYKIETPVVYNSALDDITIDDEIKLILVADNPGRREQAAENRRYLVGPSGKIAARFFLNNPKLGIDFYKNVIILNKTPIHTPRTVDLRKLFHTEALEESQRIMSGLLLEFHEALLCPVWIIGYSEMRKGGIFQVYTEELKNLYLNRMEMYKQIYFYRHFSMNQFIIDLKKQAMPGETTDKSLRRIGTAYRERILEI